MSRNRSSQRRSRQFRDQLSNGRWRKRATKSVSGKIRYLTVISNDDTRDTSPFQGFSPEIFGQTNLLESLVALPADAIEFALPFHGVLARRISGLGGWSWSALRQDQLEHFEIEVESPFFVVFPSPVVDRGLISRWASAQRIPPLIILPEDDDGHHAHYDIMPSQVRDHVSSTLTFLRRARMDVDLRPIEECVEKYVERPERPAPIAFRLHNYTLPNQMALQGAGYSGVAEPFMATVEQDCISAISTSAKAVLDVRRQVGVVEGFRDAPPSPDLILTSPSMYRHVFKMLDKPVGDAFDEGDAIKTAFSFMRRRRGYTAQARPKEVELLLGSKAAQIVTHMRMEEMLLHSVSVGLRAAGTLAGVVRLPPEVDKGIGAITQLANHARGSRNLRTDKLIKTFSAVQEQLRRSVDQDLMQLILENTAGIKIVSNAPLEWLPVGGLPLGIRFDVSRTSSVPGNLMLQQLALPDQLIFSPKAFEHILVVSAFAEGDPIRSTLTGHLRQRCIDLKLKVAIEYATVRSEDELVERLNRYNGVVMIFDGHGGAGSDVEPGVLKVGEQDVDIWGLRGRIRVPPIVILSACDTFAVDASHASVANGFLALGARTVLATFLPLSASLAAEFIARLVHRIADFVPSAINEYGRAVRWSEVVSGMFRMQMLRDILRFFLRESRITDEQYQRLHIDSNYDINTLDRNWLERLFDAMVSLGVGDPIFVRLLASKAVPLSESIRYLQLGNPEFILIDDLEARRRRQTR